MDVPAPTFCPMERHRRRLAWRNERTLYRRKCDLCRKTIISIYPSNALFPVYCPECWFSEKWDARSFGRDFDFSQQFFQQFLDLQNSVPRLSLINARNENSDYCNLVGESKNCYLIFGSLGCEDCLYGKPERSKDCLDSLILWKSELCYECVDSDNLYQCAFCQECLHSRDLAFCFDVRNSHNCFLCAGLRNAEYRILNKQYTREEYFKWKEQWSLLNRKNLIEFFEKFKKIKQSVPRKNLIGVANENVIGDHVSHSKNCFHVFDVLESEDLRYATTIEKCKTCMDADMGEFSELIYEMCGFHRMQDARLSHWCWDGCQKITYCSACRNTRDSFGCVCADNISHCILNKQYSKEEYEELVPKIIEHMKQNGEFGEFFPVKISPFSYNETAAHEYYPLVKKEALKRGYKWKDDEPKDYKPATLSTIPDNIPDNITQEVLACETCEKNYQIQKQEVLFYQKMGLPIPRKCPECRHVERLHSRNPRILYTRTCNKCSTKIQTTFAPDKPEKVYCERCYLASVE